MNPSNEFSKSSRIVLGTVQFGLAYGRRQTESILSCGTVENILDTAWKMGLRAFDTAESYGTAAQRLSEWLRVRGRLADSHVITKVAVNSGNNKPAIRDACLRFAGAKSITVLTHGTASESNWRVFCETAEKYSAKAGQSVYTTTEILRAADLGAQRVQAPGNIFDLSKVTIAQSRNIPLDVRSAFLQGVLLDPPDIADRRAPGTGQLAAAVQMTAPKVGLTPAAALLAGLMSQLTNHERVIVGIDDVHQLEDIRLALEIDVAVAEQFVRAIGTAVRGMVIGPAQLDPRTWN